LAVTGGPAGSAPRPLRRDAQTRREALLKAAAECFARSGYLVPLEDIAERAGVGRGTLYRNFKDRMALALAIFERELDKLDARLDPTLPLDRAILDLVLGGAEASALFTRLKTEMPFDDDNVAAFDQLGERFMAILQPLVERAHADGTLRADAGAREVMLAIRMMGGLIRPYRSGGDMHREVTEALSIVFRGLSPR